MVRVPETADEVSGRDQSRVCQDLDIAGRRVPMFELDCKMSQVFGIDLAVVVLVQGLNVRIRQPPAA